MTAAPDPAVLTDLLGTHVDPHASCAALRRTAVGNSQETWILDVAGVAAPSRLVLRRSAAGGTIEWTERATEVAALEAAQRAGLPVPRVWWWEPDGGALDRAYLVMDLASGAPPDLRDAGVRSDVADELGRWLARLHRDAEAPMRLRDASGDVASATAAQVEWWTSRARDSGLAPVLAMALLGWLTGTVPHDGATGVLLWGDPGPHNVLTDGGRITAMLDWELAAFGHPAHDVGAARWSCLGHLDRDALTASYEAELGRQLDHGVVAWFEVLACVGRSVMLLDGVRAGLDGRAHDPNVLALGTAMVSANLVRGAALAWGDGVLGEPATEPARLRPTPAERDLVLARFLAADVLPSTADPRVRRGLKIAVALLAGGDAADLADDSAAGEHAYESERTGRATVEDRRAHVGAMLAARRAQQSLLDLYGPTTAI